MHSTRRKLTGTTWHRAKLTRRNLVVFFLSSLTREGLSRPDEFGSGYDDVRDTSMTVTWLPVFAASEYLILVFDCAESTASEEHAIAQPGELMMRFVKV